MQSFKRLAVGVALAAVQDTAMAQMPSDAEEDNQATVGGQKFSYKAR